MFKPEFAVIATLGVCVLLAALLMGGQGVQAGAPAPQPAGLASEPSLASAQPGVSAKATLDLVKLASQNSIDEADNARWALVRGSPAGDALYDSQRGVDWKALRKLTQAGTIPLPAGESWSFNAAFQEGVGYKNASGVLAGGQCALATVLRVAADRAGLETTARQHRYPVPGFTLQQSVNIWWGRDDLLVKNPTRTGLALAWILTPQSITVSVIQAP